MSILGQLNTYNDGDVISSSEWNAELDQILQVLSSNISAVELLINGNTNETNDPILKLINTGSASYIIFGNGTGSSLAIANNGQLITTFEPIVHSILRCVNLNADQLQSVDPSALQQALFAFDQYSVFYVGSEAVTNPDKASYLVKHNLTITKLKLKQEGVATADADTTIDFLRNGVSIGTVSIAGNVTAVQTNDIGDVDCVAGDILTTNVTVHDGTTKHVNITATFHFKQKFINQ